MRRNVNALVKYEFINLKRGKLIWIIAILYAFGVEQAISSMFTLGNNFLTLVGFIKVSWLPLNFIMIPVLLISMIVGESDDDVFKILDISLWEKIISKIITIGIINTIIVIINVIVSIVIAIIRGISINYFVYQTSGYIVNTIIFLLVCSSIGLFIGQVVVKYTNEVISFIIVIMIFIVLSNFYKLSNVIFPLFNIRTVGNSFEAISYDKSYFYHSAFWIIISFIFFYITYINEYILNKRVKEILPKLSILIISCIACLYIGISIFIIRPKFYDICSRRDIFSGKYSNSENETFFNKENCGYSIDKYTMNIDINNKFKNNCSMGIKINKDRVNSLEIGLYEKLKISQVIINGQKIDYKRTNHSFIVKLPKEFNNGDLIDMEVDYEGIINTVWKQGNLLFFARNNGMFLADVFEWYPKLNDSLTKQYDVQIKYDSNRKIYTNLKAENKSGVYKLTGSDREIFLVSGNISERMYKDYLLVGNKEYINNNEQCDDIISMALRGGKLDKEDKIVIVPYIPGGTKMDKYYEKDYLSSRN